MSSPDIARRTAVQIRFDGTDVTDSVLPYFLSLTYTDNQEDEADDLQITLQDADGIWLEHWLAEIVDAAASAAASAAEEEPPIPETVSMGSRGAAVTQLQTLLVGAGYSLPVAGIDGIFGAETRAAVTAFQSDRGLTPDGVCGPLTWAALLGVSDPEPVSAGTGLSISAAVIRQNWNGDGADDKLETGAFTLDAVDCSGPPSVVKISATSMPYSKGFRQTAKSRAWEKYRLSGIAAEMASNAGLRCMFLPAEDPFYSRIEQFRESDVGFLQRLCLDAGYSLKIVDENVVIFDQAAYESAPSVRTFTKGDGSYTKYKLRVGTADTAYRSCRVYYNDPASGTCIEATVTDDSYDGSAADGHRLELCRRVSSVGEAQALAAKQLRLRNKLARTVQFTVPGDVSMAAGLCVTLSGWGGWDGKYIITKAKHSVGSGGYTTVVDARRVLEGY